MLLIVYGSESCIYFNGEVLLNVLRCQLTYLGQVVTNAEARFNNSGPEGSLGRTAQDAHLDSHTAPELLFQFYLTEFYSF